MLFLQIFCTNTNHYQTTSLESKDDWIYQHLLLCEKKIFNF